MTHHSLPTVSIVMPVLNGQNFLEKSLEALTRSKTKEVVNIIVVDDASSDDSALIAQRFGCQVLSNKTRLGPAASRNLGAREATGEILLFVDADVVIHPDAIPQIVDTMRNNEYAALFGAYDDSPPEPNFFSQYKNLLHHHMHKAADGDASTFWSGLGAVWKDIFVEVGGFHEDYANPSIEDIDLGYRLRASGGIIRLASQIQGTHLKKWDFFSLLRTDLLQRAIPWSKLLLTHPNAEHVLNVNTTEKARALNATVLGSSIILTLIGVTPLWIPFVLTLCVICTNWKLFRLFLRRKGILFAINALLFHQIYYIYCIGGFLYCFLDYQLRRFSKWRVAKGWGNGTKDPKSR